MSKTSKLCQVVHHSTHVDETCLYYVVITLDQKVITTNETNAPYEKGISNIPTAKN